MAVMQESCLPLLHEQTICYIWSMLKDLLDIFDDRSPPWARGSLLSMMSEAQWPWSYIDAIKLCSCNGMNSSAQCRDVLERCFASRAFVTMGFTVLTVNRESFGRLAHRDWVEIV